MAGSLLLSGALVYFYKQMHDVQKMQANIQDRQTKLIKSQTEISRANHEPKLRHTNISFGNRDQIKLTLENIGNGIATDLTLTCVLVTENEYYRIEPVPNSLFYIGDSVSDQYRSLTPGEKEKFNAHLFLSLRSNRFSDTRSWFTTATGKLHHTGTKSATVRLILQYKNILGDIQSEEIISAPFMVHGSTSIENALQNSMDPVAESVPYKNPNAPIDLNHLGQREPPAKLDEIDISFNSIDMILKHNLSLDIELPEELGCEVTRNGRTVKSFTTDQTLSFNGNNNDHLEHGDLVHVFGCDGDDSWQVDIIGAGDHPPEGPKHASILQRQMKLS
ncbi:COG1361 family protein [Natronolimnobius baerhuensis]|uniref:hypothetical protein n=1 Tax=Natronolimnobius baerhuensis TaxID=253108 RepID=UPI0011250013|nr:hypothetical protein [Natronolimnobius baerhuensis]